MGENKKPTSPDIKRRAKLLGLICSDSTVNVSKAINVIKAFCETMDTLGLRDSDDDNNWSILETTIFNDPEIYWYLKLVEKSRKKPKRKK